MIRSIFRSEVPQLRVSRQVTPHPTRGIATRTSPVAPPTAVGEPLDRFHLTIGDPRFNDDATYRET